MVLTSANPQAAAAAPVRAGERLTALFDPGTAHLDTTMDGQSVRTGRGRIAGTTAVAFATDPSVRGGAVGAGDCRLIVDAIDEAIRDRHPVVGLWQSGGARLDEGVAALDGVGSVFAAIVRASGRIPQISVVLGAAAGGAAYGPALTDIVIMSAAGRIFVTGPEVVRQVTGEQVTMERLGGPETHARRSGVAHVVAPDERSALAAARSLTDLLGRPGTLEPARIADADLRPHVVAEPGRSYDVRRLVDALLDAPGFELHARWAPNVVTALGRFGGRTVGVVANNPRSLGGCLDGAGADKAARFVRMCDSFGIPLIVVVDVPGYLPGAGQEWDGLLRRAGKLVHALAEAAVPRITLMTHKAYGDAYVALNSRALGATAVFAWPEADVGPLGVPATVDLVHRQALAAAAPSERPALRESLIRGHSAHGGGSAQAVAAGLIDDIISPRQTRTRIARALAGSPESRGAHNNIPL